MTENEKIKKFWDSQAENYDNSEKRYERIHTKVVENTKKFLNDDDIVLAFGCGTGAKIFKLANNAKKIYGIDISDDMIKIAQKGAIERGIDNIDFAKANIFDEKYEKESYDVILAFNVLHVLDDIPRVILRITELLKLGGLFISATPCLKEKMGLLNKIQLFLYRIIIKMHLLPKLVTRIKYSELLGLITEGNLQIIDTEKLFHKVSSYYIVARKD